MTTGLGQAAQADLDALRALQSRLSAEKEALDSRLEWEYGNTVVARQLEFERAKDWSDRLHKEMSEAVRRRAFNPDAAWLEKAALVQERYDRAVARLADALAARAAALEASRELASRDGDVWRALVLAQASAANPADEALAAAAKALADWALRRPGAARPSLMVFMKAKARIRPPAPRGAESRPGGAAPSPGRGSYAGLFPWILKAPRPGIQVSAPAPSART